jgi:hypothetical protein
MSTSVFNFSGNTVKKFSEAWAFEMLSPSGSVEVKFQLN